MSGGPVYRIGLTYWVADWFAGELPPDYAEGTALDSLADDRLLLAEPSLGLFPAVRFADDGNPSLLESRLEEIDVAQKSAEVGVRCGVYEKLEEGWQVVVIVRPEFDVAALRAEIADSIRTCGGEVVVDTVPTAECHEKQGYYVMYDERCQSSSQERKERGIFGRLRKLLELPHAVSDLPPDPSEQSTELYADAKVRADSPGLMITQLEQPPTAAIQ